MSHYVKCPKCGETFDRDIIQAVRINGRRYGHAKCYPDNNNFVPLVEKKISEEQKIKNYAKSILKEQYVAARVNKQIKDFLAEGYTASGILKTLIYWYEIKHNDISKAMGGIGIVPYVYKQALDYYYNLYLAEMANADKDIDEYRPKEIFISIDLPKKEKELKLWEDEDE